jgi:hypothetical protein
MPFSGDHLFRTKSERSALHSEGADLCTLSHNFDTEVFVTEVEACPTLWDCLHFTVKRWKSNMLLNTPQHVARSSLEFGRSLI